MQKNALNRLDARKIEMFPTALLAIILSFIFIISLLVLLMQSVLIILSKNRDASNEAIQ